jgi:hypothetical protein
MTLMFQVGYVNLYKVPNLISQGYKLVFFQKRDVQQEQKQCVSAEVIWETERQPKEVRQALIWKLSKCETQIQIL